MSVNSFTPTKNYPSFSGPINEVVIPVTYAGTTTTLTYSDVLGGFINSNNASAQTLTLPTAALLVPQIEGAQVGSALTFYVKELGAGTATLAAGAGGTTNGTMTVATANIKNFLLVVNSLPDQFGNGATYTVYSLGTAAY